MNRINILNDIKTYLGRFTQEVRNHTETSTYDINIHAETVLIPLLNKVYFVELRNYNSEIKNYPAIDLYDYNARLAIQVTSDSGSGKIKDTILKFIEKELYKTFDRLIIYIISQKQDSYKKDFNELTDGLFEFNVDRDIVDNASLSKIISDFPNLSKIAEIQEFLMSEFSEKKIDERKLMVQYKKPIITERLYLNFLSFEPPTKLYFAIIDIDDESLKSKVMQLRREKVLPYRKGGKWNIKGKDLVFAKLHIKGKALNDDFILFQDKLYTFRNLHNSNEPFREVIDIGTIDCIDSKDFYDIDENYLKKSKELIKNSLKVLLKEKGIEWINDERIFRFSAFGTNSIIPKERKVSWTKETKSQPRTVVDEMYNKALQKDNEIRLICFKHLAFSIEIEKFDTWYISIKPTWSYTNPGGVEKSRFESKYLSGIKETEKNEAVLNHFLFIANCLKTDLRQNDINHKPTTSYEIVLDKPVKFNDFAPAIIDINWLPKKTISKNKTTNQIALEF